MKLTNKHSGGTLGLVTNFYYHSIQKHQCIDAAPCPSHHPPPAQSLVLSLTPTQKKVTHTKQLCTQDNHWLYTATNGISSLENSPGFFFIFFFTKSGADYRQHTKGAFIFSSWHHRCLTSGP